MQKTNLMLLSIIVATSIAAAVPVWAQTVKTTKPPIQKAVQAHPPEFKEAKAQLDSGQPAFNQNLPSLLNSKTPLKLDQYLSVMRPLIHRYNQVMLSLIANDGIATEELPPDSQISADEIAKLAQLISQVNPPAEISEQHTSLVASLQPTVEFVKAGGCAKQGFHLALECAKQMEKISATYHDCILAAISDHGLAHSLDPFIVVRPTEKQSHPNGAKAKGEHEKKAPNISIIQKDSFWVPDSVGSNGASSLKSPGTPAMINGVDGALGMSGMFNGLGGTGTNGLVDGLGFSSGLNGFVNGAASSSSTFGMMNDTESKTSH